VFSLATDAAPGRPNEDFALASTDLAILVDGGGDDAGGACAHGVPWYSRQLGAHVMAALADEPGLPLGEGLARGIRAVSRLHVYTCDLSSPGTPSAAVAVVRLGPETVDTLSLGGCIAVVQADAGPQLTRTAGGAPGGLAAAQPQVARHALTGTYPRHGVRRVALLSDGAARAVGGPRIAGWAECLDLLDTVGPAGLLGQLRAPTGARSTHPEPTLTALRADVSANDSWDDSGRADDVTVIHASLS
jgi:hypothetical protein